MKIGTSVQPHVRVKGLEFSAWLCLGVQCGPFRLLAVLPGHKAKEEEMLSNFNALRIGGKRREWLKHSHSVRRFFMKHGAVEAKSEPKKAPGRPPSITSCPYCNIPINGVAAFRNHLPRCPKRKVAA